MMMPGRSYTAGSSTYRYRFNGKEIDPNITSEDYDYGARIFDARVVRFLSVDPLIKSYPWYTPYQFAGNTPIQAVDLDGKEESHYLLTLNKQGQTQLKLVNYKTVTDGLFGWKWTQSKIPERYIIDANGTSYYIGFNGAKGTGNNDPSSIALARALLKTSNPSDLDPKTISRFFYDEEKSWKLFYDNKPNPLIEAAWGLLGAIEKYPGVFNEYSKQTVSQSQRTVRSTEKTIAEHEKWLEDPLTKPDMTQEKWDSMSDKAREGLLNKWKKDVERNKDYLKIAKHLLESKQQQ